MSESLVELKNVGKSYGKIKAVSGLSFSIKRGAITAFLGENGAGKTTTIKLILGFLRPDSGQVSHKSLSIGFIPDRPVFFSWLSGQEILEITARYFGMERAELKRRVKELSPKIGFDTTLLARKVQSYSMGNQKKISYLQSLIILPDLLIADEPFAGLDPVSIKLVRDLFVELRNSGKTLFLSSHLISELEKIYDEVIIIRKGQIVFSGSREEMGLNGQPDLEALFLTFQRDPNSSVFSE